MFLDWIMDNRILILIPYVILNLISFSLYGIDKAKAKKKAWRISEKTLLLSAAIFGGIGAFTGMRIFRHKTQHLQFQILVPLCAIVQIALLVAFFVL